MFDQNDRKNKKKSKPKYGQFMRTARMRDAQILTVPQHEDAFWTRVKAAKNSWLAKYSVDNDLSLFHEDSLGNFNNFTNHDSLIQQVHSSQFIIFHS